MRPLPSRSAPVRDRPTLAALPAGELVCAQDDRLVGMRRMTIIPQQARMGNQDAQTDGTRVAAPRCGQGSGHPWAEPVTAPGGDATVS